MDQIIMAKETTQKIPNAAPHLFEIVVDDLESDGSRDDDWLGVLLLALDVLDVSLDHCYQVLEHLAPGLGLLHPLVLGLLQVLDPAPEVAELGAGLETLKHPLGGDALQLLKLEIDYYLTTTSSNEKFLLEPHAITHCSNSEVEKGKISGTDLRLQLSM